MTGVTGRAAAAMLGADSTGGRGLANKHPPEGRAAVAGWERRR